MILSPRAWKVFDFTGFKNLVMHCTLIYFHRICSNGQGLILHELGNLEWSSRIFGCRHPRNSNSSFGAIRLKGHGEHGAVEYNIDSPTFLRLNETGRRNVI